MQTSNRHSSFGGRAINFSELSADNSVDLSNPIKIFINRTSFEMNGIMRAFFCNPLLLEEPLVQAAPIFKKRLSAIEYCIQSPSKVSLFDNLYSKSDERAFSVQDKYKFILASKKLYLSCMKNYVNSPYITCNNGAYIGDSVEPVREFIHDALAVIVPENTLGAKLFGNVCDSVYDKFGNNLIKACLGAASARHVRESAMHGAPINKTAAVKRVPPQPHCEPLFKFPTVEASAGHRK